MIWAGLATGLLTLLGVATVALVVARLCVPQNRTERPVEATSNSGRPNARPGPQSDPVASPKQLQAIARKLAQNNGGGPVEQWLPIAQRLAPTQAKAEAILRRPSD